MFFRKRDILYELVFQCDVLIEKYEDVIEDWYKGSQEEDLTTYLCEKHVLKGQDAGTSHKYIQSSFSFSTSSLLPQSLFPSFPGPACLNEEWTAKKKGDQAAIAEDKKKKKKKKGGKKGEGGDGGSEGEKSTKKKKEKKVKKKKKSKAPVEKANGGVSSDEDIQPQMPLSGQKTEL